MDTSMYANTYQGNVGHGAIAGGSQLVGERIRPLMAEMNSLDQALGSLEIALAELGKQLTPVTQPTNGEKAQTATPQAPVANELCGRIRGMRHMVERMAEAANETRRQLVI